MVDGGAMVGGKSKRRKEIGRRRASKRGREKRRGATRRGTNTMVPLQTNSRGSRGLLSSVSIPPGVLERERTVLFGPSTLSGLVCKPRGPPGLFSTTTTTAESLLPPLPSSSLSPSCHAPISGRYIRTRFKRNSCTTTTIGSHQPPPS